MKTMKNIARTLFLLVICLMLSQIPASAASSTVAKIGSKRYSSLQKALDAVKNGQTIKLQKNITIKDVMETPSKKFTLDLNGHTIKQGSTTFYVTTTNGKENYLYEGCLTVSKGSTVTLKNGTFNAGINCKNGSKLTIESGTYKKTFTMPGQ